MPSNAVPVGEPPSSRRGLGARTMRIRRERRDQGPPRLATRMRAEIALAGTRTTKRWALRLPRAHDDPPPARALELDEQRRAHAARGDQQPGLPARSPAP